MPTMTAIELRARDWLAAYGLLFCLRELDRGFLRRAVRRSTKVCIEGYPRSANSYALLAFRRWNPGLRVANHLHTPLQITRAVKLGIPCAVLIRPPVDAVASVLVMERERISDTAAYRAYIHFYSRSLRVRDRVVVAPFEDVTRDPAAMVDRINALYGTAFAAEPLSEKVDAELRAELEARPAARGLPPTSYPAPSPEKDRRNAEIKHRVAAHPLREAAERLHSAWVGDRS